MSSPDLPPVSDADIDTLVSAGTLLLALDVDGTLAGFSTDPMSVRLVPDAHRAVQVLRQLPHTTVMLLSGRDLSQLRVITGYEPVPVPTAEDIRLVGSHGAEPADVAVSVLTDVQAALLDQVTSLAEEYAGLVEGMWVERKPFSRGLHRRGVPDGAAAVRATEHFRAAVTELDGVHVTDGKDILEVAVTDMTKGRYLQWYTGTTEPDRVLFVGDDVTDETALGILRPQDLGVKVGAGETTASRRVADPSAVGELLLRIAAARGARGLRP
ncbi:trehalose-phosphatase [Corynebacterium terpenotabidum]|uniref:Trehalose 6-phosphate phosphatase n=1 Tax=Corynebacterium terpenotabidum Y-11 TaxID=1200352 RepID=S4XHG4_9CORY|nr:trehalose-phosphatase [Corynebacterium terpenotabidum]AGP30088.1 trehalose-6-phosphate phosphatase [Corynebacterium terpenotabidum Y-11]